MSAGRWLYLPLDVKVRELDGKLFFAARAAARGWNAVIGQKRQVAAAMPFLPPGFFAGFGGQENFAKSYAQYRALGHKILILDEEGLVTHNEDIYARTRLCDAALAQCDLFSFWGEVQRDMVLRRRPDLAGKSVVSGNPRMDVLRPEFSALRTEEAAGLRARFGRFILLNSNFGSCNHFTGGDAYFESLKTKKVIQSQAEETHYRRYFDYRAKVMEAILGVLPTLSAAFSDMNIVVRPHPSERADAWKERAAGLPNIHVLHEGSVLPWIAATQCVLHNFCTTAIESHALGVPAVSYRPVIDDTLESPLPTLVSHVAKTPEDLVATLRRAIDQRPPSPADPDEVHRYACNLGGGPFASDILLDAMEKFAFPEAGGRRAAFPAVPAFALRDGLRALREYLSVSLKGRNADQGYIAHKFSGLSRAEMSDILGKLAQAQPFAPIPRISRVGESLWWVRS